MKHVKSTDDNPIYSSLHYKMQGFTVSQYSSSLHNVLLCIIAQVANAIRDNQNKFLPKAMVFVYDADIIQQTNISKHYAEKDYK